MLDWELCTAFVVIGSLATAAFFAGRYVSASSRSPGLLIASSIVFSLLFCLSFHARLGWAKVIPMSGVVLWSNLTPIILVFSAGIAWNTTVLQRHLRTLIVSSLGLLAAAYLVSPIVRPWIDPPRVAAIGHSLGRICLQSHDSTCAPAAAATLLRLNGIDSNEKEMIDSCLTSQLGTEPLGIFRGLKLAIRNREHDVRIASRNPKSWGLNGQLPNVAMVHFPDNEFGPLGKTVAVPSRFLGPRREAGHAIVVIGQTNGKWTIADPAIGLVEWSDEELLNRFTGDAIYLSRK